MNEYLKVCGVLEGSWFHLSLKLHSFIHETQTETVCVQ